MEAGSDWECAGKVVVLRLTPVVPFAVSNYVLGLTELGVFPFVVGTTVGMLPWAMFYVVLGASGRGLLRGGEDPSQIVAGACDCSPSVCRLPRRYISIPESRSPPLTLWAERVCGGRAHGAGERLAAGAVAGAAGGRGRGPGAGGRALRA